MFITSFKRQNNIASFNSITEITFDHFSVVNDVKAGHAFRSGTLLFHITQFFNIGSIGEVCLNILFFLFQHIANDVYWYYLVELSFYWCLVFSMLTDHKRKVGLWYLCRVRRKPVFSVFDQVGHKQSSTTKEA